MVRTVAFQGANVGRHSGLQQRSKPTRVSLKIASKRHRNTPHQSVSCYWKSWKPHRVIRSQEIWAVLLICGENAPEDFDRLASNFSSFAYLIAFLKFEFQSDCRRCATLWRKCEESALWRGQGQSAQQPLYQAVYDTAWLLENFRNCCVKKLS